MPTGPLVSGFKSCRVADLHAPGVDKTVGQRGAGGSGWHRGQFQRTAVNVRALKFLFAVQPCSVFGQRSAGPVGYAAAVFQRRDAGSVRRQSL